MLAYEPAKTEQYDDFMQLMRNNAADYLERSLRLMEMTEERFNHMFRTVGQVYGIHTDGDLAGFYWIEEREGILHLHALILSARFQKRGIGTQVLNMLETEYRSKMDAIELGVYEQNVKAMALYERQGYKLVQRLSEFGFYIMQKKL